MRSVEYGVLVAPGEDDSSISIARFAGPPERDLSKDLRQRCLEMPDPAPSAIFEHVYAEPHSLLREEREQYAAYLEGFEG